ncbi:tetratricopeptide repeat protein [Bacillus massiliglaciei]|uniref:tetratricopeptide repeat protein n=1 Tax=Bacillus massiliglaciei TaxID=1816693 RepID=UPI000A71588A|nr:tetratricopeptide repeat protein [Bacillus massiliglaciei]
MEELKRALDLRMRSDHQASNKLLKELARQYPEAAIIQYQCACSHDLLGLETEAVPYYEKALSLGLESGEAQGAYIGLGSSYRISGEYEKSKAILEEGLKKFPENRAIQVFYSMVLYNLGHYGESIKNLLKIVADTSMDPDIQEYQRAIDLYHDKLEPIR